MSHAKKTEIQVAVNPAVNVTANATANEKMLARAQALVSQAPFKSAGQVSVGKQVLQYDIETSFIPVYNDNRELQAAVGYTAYHLKGQNKSNEKIKTKGKDINPRPLMFVFNGGPGSSCVWLHLGAIGPKRVVINDDGSAPAPPYAIEDNPFTWLEFADLVFVDPVRTGFSVSASEEALKKQCSLFGDVEYLSEAIREYLQRSKQNNRPIYLSGESYGTTRGAGIANTLADLGVLLSGVVLISLAMDFQTFVFAPRNDLPYQAFLAAYAATAWYHGKIKTKNFNQLVADADAFAGGEYAAALYAGNRLTEKERGRVAAKLADFTGLPSSLILANNLRIDNSTFFTELMRDQGKIVGRLDSRTLLPMAAKQDRTIPFDPGMSGIYGPYSAAMANYLRHDLNVTLADRYYIMSPLYLTWNYNTTADGKDNEDDGRGNSFAAMSTKLSSAMRKAPHMRVLVMNGYFDLATPFSGSDFQIAQLDIDAASFKRIAQTYYHGGHMMYTKQSELKQVFVDVQKWMG